MKEEIWIEWRGTLLQEFNNRLTAMGTKGNFNALGRKGLTALFILTRDIAVSADEILPMVVKTLKDKDTKDSKKVDLISSDEEQNDNLALIGHRIGMFDSSDDMGKYLQDANQATKPYGQLLFTSFHNNTVDKTKQSFKQNNDSRGYTGNSVLQFQFKEIMGPYFGIFHLDLEILRSQAARTDWQYRILRQEDKNNFAVLLKH